MMIKICQTCQKPFRGAASPYVKFCTIECVDAAYTGRRLDKETMDQAVKLLQDDISLEREIETQALREIYYLEILKINRLISEVEFEEHKKDILESSS